MTSRQVIRVIRTEGIWAIDRVLMKIESRRRSSPIAHKLQIQLDWPIHLHNLLGAEYPCIPCDRYETSIWPAIVARLPRNRERSQHSHDSDPALARALWSVMVHARPEQVVETGVARGITSATILTAIRDNGIGHLYSIDLPPLRSSWPDDIGAAVGRDLHERWTYIRGSSPRRLPELIRRLRTVDLFLHDSLHTYETMHFEFDTVWPALRPGGILIADDIESNAAFDELSAASPNDRLIAKQMTKEGSLFGVFLKATQATVPRAR